MNSATFTGYVPHAAPRRWPFPPSRPAPARTPARPAPQAVEPAPLRQESTLFQGATRRQVVADVLMVAAWGAMIPGLLWFGHWMGF